MLNVTVIAQQEVWSIINWVILDRNPIAIFKDYLNKNIDRAMLQN